jgi:hypothetical protein
MRKRMALCAALLAVTVSNVYAQQSQSSKLPKETGIARPIPCPIRIAQACAAMAASETDTCFQYACEQVTLPGQPTILHFACVQTVQQQGTACHDPGGACVTAGACDANGGCTPTEPENEISCSETCAAQNEGVGCVCLNYQCYAQSKTSGVAPPGSPTSTWCTKGTGSPQPQQNCSKASLPGDGTGSFQLK